MTSSTPENVSIERRRSGLYFDESQEVIDWTSISISVQIFLDTFSCYLPLGEHFFIDSVIYYKDVIRDEKLREEVKKFVYQEAQHSITHCNFNNALTNKVKLAGISEFFTRIATGLARHIFSRRMQLSITAAVEHFTAITSNILLTHADGFLRKNQSNAGLMWVWHAIEETEHKSVAFDVFMEVTPNKYHAYILRISGMVLVSLILFPAIAINMPLVYLGNIYYRHSNPGKKGNNSNANSFAEKTGRPEIKTGNPAVSAAAASTDKVSETSPPRKARDPSFLLFNHVIYISLKPYIDYYRLSFHPWQHDNSHLLNEVKAKFDFDTVKYGAGS